MRPTLATLALVSVLVAVPLAAVPFASGSSQGNQCRTDSACRPVLEAMGEKARGTGSITWTGRPLATWPGDDGSDPMCVMDRPDCDRVEISLKVPAGFWDRNDGHLEFAVRWAPPQDIATASPFDLYVFAADGTLLAEAASEVYAGQVLLPEPAAGTYIVVVDRFEPRLDNGFAPPGAYEAVLQVDHRAGGAPPAELLPDAVPAPVQHLQLTWTRTRIVAGGGPELRVPALVEDARGQFGATGCHPEETTRSQALRCLRFAAGIGNVGEGPLDLVVPANQHAHGLAGMAAWRQRVHATDGSYTETDAGAATFEPFHGHFHHDDIVRYALHEVLPDGTRGAEVVKARKVGMNYCPEGLQQLGVLGTRPHLPCNADDTTVTWRSSLGPGWFDLYETSVPDQGLDITDVPDGTYDLVVTVDPEGWLREASTANNEAAVRFTLEGDTLTVHG